MGLALSPGTVVEPTCPHSLQSLAAPRPYSAGPCESEETIQMGPVRRVGGTTKAACISASVRGRSVCTGGRSGMGAVSLV